MRNTPELTAVLTKLRASNPAAWADFKRIVADFREQHVTHIIRASDFGALKLVQGELAATDKLLLAITSAEKPIKD